MPKQAKKTETTADRQRKAMWQLVRKTMTTDEFRVWIFELTNGKSESSSDLSFEQKNHIILKCGGVPFSSRQKRKTTYFAKKSNVVEIDPISPEALYTIGEFRAKLPGLVSNESFEKLCNRTIKKPFPTRVIDGQRIIEALKSMIKQAERKQKAA